MTPSRRPPAPLRRLGSRVSRRGLLGAGVLAGVLAASGVPLQAGTRGGVLRIGLSGPLPAGPEGWARAPRVLGVGALYDTLTEIGPSGELRGELASSWEAAPDAATWRIALRRDARFHDGRPLTSADVTASLLRQRQGPSAWALAGLDRVEAEGPHAVRIELAEGNPDLPFLLAEPGLVIGPEGHLHGVGTGLYRLALDRPAERLRLERVAGHWKDGRAGWFEAVEALAFPDPRDRLLALLEGDVDVAAGLGPDLLAEAREAGQAVTEVTGNRQLHVALPAGAPTALRERLARGVDRAALARTWDGRVAADHPLGALHPSLAPLAPPPLDPEAARALAGQALELSLWDGGATEDATFRKALAGPWAALQADAELGAVLRAAQRSDGEERAALYAEAQAICARAAPVVVAAQVPTAVAHVPHLRNGGAVSPLGSLDGGRLPERWWFA